MAKLARYVQRRASSSCERRRIESEESSVKIIATRQQVTAIDVRRTRRHASTLIDWARRVTRRDVGNTPASRSITAATPKTISMNSESDTSAGKAVTNRCKRRFPSPQGNGGRWQRGSIRSVPELVSKLTKPAALAFRNSEGGMSHQFSVISFLISAVVLSTVVIDATCSRRPSQFHARTGSECGALLDLYRYDFLSQVHVDVCVCDQARSFSRSLRRRNNAHTIPLSP
jgi:hypothetical protein